MRVSPEDTAVDRAFVRIREGQVHYRTAGGGAARPLWMIHASPSSGLNLVPLMRELAVTRRVLAPDTPGNGDSAPLGVEQPEIVDYADAAVRTMDALGLDRVDLYGSHTGAHIAMEIAIARPERVERLVLDGIAMFTAEDKREFVERYAPGVQVDAFGSQLWWAWHFVRDQAWFFPYFRRDGAHNRGAGQPSPEGLHATTVEVLKAVRTYHLAYRAAFRHPDRERLPLVEVPTLVMADEADPLHAGVHEAASLVRGARRVIVPGEATPAGRRAKADLIRRFLDGETVGEAGAGGEGARQ
jgi:pimeloyl-ACP methyl ester carboxylesterase